MSTPIAQQRPLTPLRPRIVEVETSPAFAQWLAAGQTNARGTIQQPSNRDFSAFIKPDLFPEERLYFSFKEWSPMLIKMMRRGGVQGRPVIFDVDPQTWRPELTLPAKNVRLT